MARGSKKQVSAAAASDPEVEERARLKGLAFSSNVLSQKPVRFGPSSSLAPSKTVVKHHGRDILRKSQRKNRYLFSFPGLLGPVSGGKIGELKNLGTKNPILYLDFPQGQMKLSGTIVYPKNRYLTLQFSKGGKNVTCDDYFDNMIVFSDAWWIGKKEDNPEELRLQFPKELNVENNEGYGFKGGVGSACDGQQGSGKLTKKSMEQVSPEILPGDNLTDNPSDCQEFVNVTPTRHSARTARKTFNFAEASSEDDFIVDGDETPEDEDEKVDIETRTEAESSRSLAFEVDNKDNVGPVPASGQYDWEGKAKDPPDSVDTPLFQTTISSLFMKVVEKTAKKDMKQKRDTSEVSKHMKREKKIGERESVYRRKSKNKASSTASSKKQLHDLVLTSQSPDPNDSSQVEEDDIEELSGSSQEVDASDEEWTG